METRPKFKNSFNVTGTFGELMHFKEIAISLGWEHSENSINNFSEKLIAFQFRGRNCHNTGRFWNIIDLNGNESISLSTPSGWQRALSLAEEKEEKVPEYVECLKSTEPGDQFTLGKIYKVNGVEGDRYKITSDNGNLYNGWNVEFFKPSTAEAYARQELLEQAKMVDNIIHEQFGTAIKDCIKSMEQLSEALKETLNKIKK